MKHGTMRFGINNAGTTNSSASRGTVFKINQIACALQFGLFVLHLSLYETKVLYRLFQFISLNS